MSTIDARFGSATPTLLNTARQSTYSRESMIELRKQLEHLICTTIATNINAEGIAYLISVDGVFFYRKLNLQMPDVAYEFARGRITETVIVDRVNDGLVKLKFHR